jgi:hypothetical protein
MVLDAVVAACMFRSSVWCTAEPGTAAADGLMKLLVPYVGAVMATLYRANPSIATRLLAAQHHLLMGCFGCWQIADCIVLSLAEASHNG